MLIANRLDLRKIEICALTRPRTIEEYWADTVDGEKQKGVHFASSYT